jgi:uncharacterized protein YggE
VGNLIVRGEGFAPGHPDEIVVALDVSAVRASAEQAYDDVAVRSETLSTLLDELGIEAAARSTAGVSIQPNVEWDEHGRSEQRGYHASNSLVIRTPDQGVVSTLLREAVTRAGADVTGPWWRIASTNPARSVACREAALDARRKADAYADALGQRIVGLVELRERVPTAAEMTEAYGARMAMSAEVAVTPGKLDVRAAVEATFALEPL